MKVKEIFFVTSEDGAITVDWVVLTATVLGLAGAAVLALHGPTGDVGDSVGAFLSDEVVVE